VGLGTSEKRRKSGRVRLLVGDVPLVAYVLILIVFLSDVFAGRRTTVTSCEIRLVAAKCAAVLIPRQYITASASFCRGTLESLV
jgi:hypothetical protein